MFSVEAEELISKMWLNKISEPEKYVLNPAWVEPSEAEKEANNNMFKSIRVGPAPIITKN